MWCLPYIHSNLCRYMKDELLMHKQLRQIILLELISFSRSFSYSATNCIENFKTNFLIFLDLVCLPIAKSFLKLTFLLIFSLFYTKKYYTRSYFLSTNCNYATISSCSSYCIINCFKFLSF